ncbi:hypothetical protein QJS04_geneDACA017227 [Acorus gramineus]|uniref:phosphatidate phosphatase n=1 Tax=Acorus gramineus TaxID=55184 RepID=A0AAV8ZZB4_ACOGR|nr:hypothetical protein QJS04_geneDACA017227 [Acorus gramineus]
MNAVERLSSYISRGVYTVSGPFHPFGGAVDIIVVQQPDGSFKSTPWYVRFGKFQGVLKTKEKVVSISVNGIEAGFHMYLDHKGEAYFLKDADEMVEEGDVLYLLSSGDETDSHSKSERLNKTQSCNFDGDRRDGANGKMVVARTNSKRSRFLGLMFGRRSMKVEDGSRGGGVERVNSLERAEIAADLLDVKWSTNRRADDWRTGTNASKLSVSDSLPDEVNKNVCDGNNGPKGDNFSDDLLSRDVTVGDVSLDKLDVDDTDMHSIEIGGVGVEETDLDKMVKVSLSGSPNTDLQSDLENLGMGENAQCRVVNQFGDTPEAYDASCRYWDTLGPKEGSADQEIPSFIYCETSETSTIAISLSNAQAFEDLDISFGGLRGVEVSSHIVHETKEVIPEANLEQKSSEFTCQENVDAFNNLNLNEHRDEGDLKNPISESVEVESSTSCFTGEMLVESDIIEKEAKQVEHQDIVVQEGSCDAIDSEKEYRMPNQMVENEQMRSLGELESQGFSSLDLSGSTHHIEEAAIETEIPVITSPLSTMDAGHTTEQLSNDLEENQSQHGNISEIRATSNSSEIMISSDATKMENQPSLVSELPTDEQILNKEAVELSTFQSLSAEFSRKLGSPDVPRTQVNPIHNEKSDKPLANTVRPSASSPNIRSCISDLETSAAPHHHRHSLSLDSNISNPGEVEDSSSLRPNTDSDCHFVNDQPTSMSAAVVAETHSTEEHEGVLISHCVELSLCRHLLFEGMGAEAAAQAFRSERLDLERFRSSGPSILKNDKLVVRVGGRYYSWDVIAPNILGMVSFGLDHVFGTEGAISVDRADRNPQGDASRDISPSNVSWRLWPFSFKKSTTMRTIHSVADGNKEAGNNNTSEGTDNVSKDNNKQKNRCMRRKVQSVTPTSEQLASLNLKDGRNVITFSFSTAMLGTQQVDARIYLWKWNTRIVISDVDGTITKSDVLGQFMPLVGRDWSQIGVAHLFSAIKDNGYQFLFLSARAISQAYLTRQFLLNLKQDGKALPDGPVLISPDGLFPSLFREVIRRAPHEFKIACLEDIRAVFPHDCNPFYAGFGNRDTDEISYLRVGIPKGKIFIINPRGEVAVDHWLNTKSYTSLHALVNGMFPPVSSAEQEDFNSWNYWKMPLPDIDI